jgi:hypothetical protein
MFETYSEMGIDQIQITDVVNGALSFLCVALGGTIVGKKHVTVKEEKSFCL